MLQSAYKLQHTRVEIPESRLPAPILSYDVGRNRWRLERSYPYQDGPYLITVPEGFDFDLASVPRHFWFLIAPFELSIVAPLLHDYLYAVGGNPPTGVIEPPRTYTRKEADQQFRRIMEQEGIAVWRRTLAYLAVRWFGRSRFRG